MKFYVFKVILMTNFFFCFQTGNSMELNITVIRYRERLNLNDKHCFRIKLFLSFFHLDNKQLKTKIKDQTTIKTYVQIYCNRKIEIY